MIDILTIGAATRDVFVRSSRFEQVKSPHAPDGLNACIQLGAKIPIDELVFETGGGATNAATTFARFGFRASCLTRVGNDAGGREILTRLRRDRVDARAVQTDPKDRTGYSIILLAGAGHRAILTARGASANLDRRTIPWTRLASRWMYLTSVSGNTKLLTDIFSRAKRSLASVAWNPGGSEIALGLKRLEPWLMQTDILILNREEAAELSGCSPRFLDCIFRTLGPLPRTALVVTDGIHGAYAYSRGAVWLAPAQKGRAVNTTGAGDAFGSAFVAAVMKSHDLETALKAGTLNAANVVRHMGAKAGILPKFPPAKDLSRLRVHSM